MSATHEDLALRLQRLERNFQELTHSVSHPSHSQPRDLADMISLRAWMKTSAPTFAVMTIGFTLLWNAQQAGNAQLFEMSRSLGRLDGSIDRLDASIERIDSRMTLFDERLVSIDRNIASLDANVAKLGTAVDRLARKP